MPSSMSAAAAQVGNLLLPCIEADLARREPMEVVRLDAGDVLCAADEPVEFVYFVDHGLVTLLASTSQGQSVEIATLGRESIVGAIACLDMNALPFEARVQVAGHARRLRSSVICDELGKAATPLTAVVLRYLQYEVCQLTQSAICNRFHGSSARLAKWLLLACQRLPTCAVPLTHEAIAQLVGGPRHEVSRDLARLEDAGALRRGRGMLEVTNPLILRDLACECVGRIDAAYRMLTTRS